MSKLSWKFILRACLFYCLFAAPLRALFSLILRFCWILVFRSLCVMTYFIRVLLFSFSGLLFFHYFHRLLQCCALVIRMCTICITRFLICVYSLASQRLITYNIFGITESRLDSRIILTRILTFPLYFEKRFTCYWTDWYCSIHTQLYCWHYTQVSRPWKWPCWMHLAWSETKYEHS